MKRSNCRLANLQVFQILVLPPFFSVKGFSHYGDSVLSRMFGGKKDMLYSYMSQDDINWRNVMIYRITNWLVAKVVVRDDHKKSRLPAVLIADDTDLPKTGFQMESIGKIFSHVHRKCILGYKVLMLCWSDGRTQLMLDFSLHGDIGGSRLRTDEIQHGIQTVPAFWNGQGQNGLCLFCHCLQYKENVLNDGKKSH